MLRRLKTERFDGKPLLTLPPLAVEVRCEPLGDEERRIYDALAHAARVQLSQYLERGGTLQANYMNVLSMLTRLRQACDSPELVEAAFSAATAAANAANAKPTDDAKRRAERLAEEPEDCPICMDPVARETGAVTACGHAFCDECIKECVHRGADKCPNCRAPLAVAQIFPLAPLMPAPAAAVERPPPPSAPVEDEASSSASSASALPPPSTKTRMVLEAVREMLAGDSSSKCILFSSFTRYLDIVQSHLSDAGYACARIDGSMDVREREKQISTFHGPDAPVLLMSLKCGVGLNLTCADTVLLLEPWWNPAAEDQAVARVHRIGQSKPVRVLRLTTATSLEERIVAMQERKRRLAQHALADVAASAAGDGGGAAAAQLNADDVRRLFDL